MCLVVVINVRDGYNFPFSENIHNRATIWAPNNATAAILDVSHKDFTVRAIGQMKVNRSTYAGAIFDSILS